MSERSYLFGVQTPKLYAPPRGAPTAQIMAYATLTALSLAAHAAGAALGEAYYNALAAYENDWPAEEPEK